MSDYKREDSPEAIRANIERTRAEMGAKIDRIGERLSPEQLREQAQESVNEMMTDTANRINRYVRDNRRELGENLFHTVKHNPVPTALIGLGLGWLLVESFTTSSDDDYDYDDRYARRRRAQYARSGYDYASGTYGSSYDPRYGTGYRRGPVQAGDANGSPYEESYYGGYPDSEGYDERYAQRTYEDWYGREAFDASNQEESDGRNIGEAMRERGRDVRDRAENVAHEAGHQANRMGEQIRHGAEEARDRTRDSLDAAGSQLQDMSQEARHQAAEAGRTVRHQTAQAGRTMQHEAARAGRVMRRQANRAGRQVGRSLEDNPMTFGILAFGAGLALSLLLPETRMENRTMGRVSEQVKESGYEMAQDAAQRAQRVMDEVRPELEQTARKVGEDLRDTAREAQHDVQDTIDKAKHEAKAESEDAKSKAKEEADKVKQTAKQEARKNG